MKACCVFVWGGKRSSIRSLNLLLLNTAHTDRASLTFKVVAHLNHNLIYFFHLLTRKKFRHHQKELFLQKKENINGRQNVILKTAQFYIRLKSYGLRHASVILWYTSVYVHCKPAHIHRYLVRNYAKQQNSCTKLCMESYVQKAIQEELWTREGGSMYQNKYSGKNYTGF